MARLIVACCLLFASILPLLADEQVRQVQEELRKRNLYFGDINGLPSHELVSAIRKYQARKGFAVTGEVDEDTATSLDVPATVAVRRTAANWPNMPVLRSDAARQVPEATRIALQRRAEENPDPSPSLPPPAESPAPGQNLTPDQVTKFVDEYLRAGETQDVSAQVRYYSFPVEYFDDGRVDEHFVERDTAKYVKRWPERKYMLTQPVTFLASGKEGETNVEFTIAFNVRNKNQSASGKTRNFWTIRPDGGDLKIVAIREERVRE